MNMCKVKSHDSPKSNYCKNLFHLLPMLPKGYHMENKKKYILKNDVVLKHHTNKKGKTTLGKMPFNNTKKKLEQVLNNFLQKNG